ncbi:MAG TPA: hypothetical protein PKH31_15960, partial [Candidatus Sumerlaeota bacterium]|nr:hypothetical protein [Candidatus Sumerlaeota bacterium]
TLKGFNIEGAKGGKGRFVVPFQGTGKNKRIPRATLRSALGYRISIPFRDFSEMMETILSCNIFKMRPSELKAGKIACLRGKHSLSCGFA